MDNHDLPPQAAAPLQTSLAAIQKWIDKITAEVPVSPDNDLRNLRAVLIHLLDITEPDPAIDAAVDDLSAAAAAYLDEVARAAVMQTEVGDRAVARQLTTVQVGMTALRRSPANAKPRSGVLW